MNPRLLAWYNGELEDDELTLDEIYELEFLVQEAIVRKILANPAGHTHPSPTMLQ